MSRLLRDVLQQSWYTLKGFLVALLPYPENQRLASAWGVNAATSSVLIGVIEMVVGLGLFFVGAVHAVQGGSAFFSRLLLENWFPELSAQHFRGSGMIALMTWFIHPLAWFLMLLAVTGVTRIAAYVASQQSIGEPIVWAALRTGQLLSRFAVKAKHAHELGPLQRDRFNWGAGCDLEILSCRDRPAWTEDATLEVQGQFYRLLGPGRKTPDGTHWVLAYRFCELDANAVIRGLVHYRDITDRYADNESPAEEELP